MARTQAKLFASIWKDPDWLALPSGAKNLYVLLLSQPKLSLAGCLDIMVARWAAMSPDTTTESVEAALGELEAARFVLVDAEHGELVIRSFVANDIGRGTVNSNLVKGMWGAWESIMSPVLRKMVVDEMPADLFDRCPDEVPSEAAQMRSEPRLEPWSQPQSEPQLEPQLEPQSEPSVVGIPTRLTENTTTSGLRSTHEPSDQDVRAAAVAVGKRVAEVERAENPGAYAASVTKRILTEADATDRDRIRAALSAGKTAAEVADGWAPKDYIDHPIFGRLGTDMGPPPCEPYPGPAQFVGHEAPERDDSLNRAGLEVARANARGAS